MNMKVKRIIVPAQTKVNLKTINSDFSIKELYSEGNWYKETKTFFHPFSALLNFFLLSRQNLPFYWLSVVTVHKMYQKLVHLHSLLGNIPQHFHDEIYRLIWIFFLCLFLIILTLKYVLCFKYEIHTRSFTLYSLLHDTWSIAS